MSLLASLLLTQLGWAQAPEFSVEMWPTQFKGSPLVLDLRIHNPHTVPLSIPDLSVQPDLVRFQLRYGGTRERRYNTPGTGNTAAMWQIEPGQERALRLEVPATAGLQTGQVKVDIEVQLTPSVQLPTQELEIVSPAPVAGDLSGLAGAPGTQHPDVAWVHQKGQQQVLVLQHQQGQRRYQLALANVSGVTQPWLSRSRRDALGERSIVWLTGTQRLSILRLRGQQARGEPIGFDLPWPLVEIIGHPVTDGDGLLSVPMWVADPSGESGALRLAIIAGKRTPAHTRIVALKRRPEQVLSTLDAAGRPMLFVVQPDRIDIFTPTEELIEPWTRRTLWKAPSGTEVLTVALGDYPANTEHAGGTAVLVASRWPTGIATQWMSLQGEPLQGAAIIPDLGAVVDLIPRAEDWPALRFADGTIVVGDQQHKAAGKGQLAPAGTSLIWRTLTQEGPVNDQPIKLSE